MFLCFTVYYVYIYIYIYILKYKFYKTTFVPKKRIIQTKCMWSKSVSDPLNLFQHSAVQFYHAPYDVFFLEPAVCKFCLFVAISV